ncbi:MAG TPA: hypothetical protein VF596_08790 [Pyrinomonadaceae bacterium]|jgi:hypothetical protein
MNDDIHTTGQGERLQTRDAPSAQPSKPDTLTGAELSKILAAIPPPYRETVERSIIERSSLIFGNLPPPPDAFDEKITSEHIGQVISNYDKDGQRFHEDKQRDRFFKTIWIVLFAAIFVFLTYFLAKDQESLYFRIVELLVAFAGGFLGGYGYKAFKQKDEEEE